MNRLLCSLVLSAITSVAATSLQAQAVSDHRLRLGGGLSYTVGAYSEMEGSSVALLPLGRRLAVSASYGAHAGNDRVTTSVSFRPPVAGRLQPYVGLGAYWLPPDGFAAETRRVGGVATAGLELATGTLTALHLDSWLFTEAQVLTASTVRAPLLFGVQFTLSRTRLRTARGPDA